MSDNRWCVYKHTNLINGKIYIGKTCRKPEYRWNEGKGYCGQKHFWYAIQKYGWNNFLHEIIYSNLSNEEASALEIQLISKYNSMDPSKGYNQTAGGEGMLGWHHTEFSRAKIIHSNQTRIISESTKKKQSASHKGLYLGEKNPFWGHKHSALTKEKISNANKGKSHVVTLETRQKISQAKIGKPNPISDDTKRKISIANKGHKVSDETKKKMSIKLSGVNNPMYGKIPVTAKGVIQYTISGIEVKRYVSATHAFRETGISNSAIGSCCKGNLKTAGGYIWRYTDASFPLSDVAVLKYSEAIIKYSLRGEYLKRYNNIDELVSVENVNKCCILKNCNHQNKTSYGYIWRFESDAYVIENIIIKSDPLETKKGQTKELRKVLCYTLTGEFYGEYSSPSSAAQIFKTSISTITDCCKGRSKSAKKKIFIYKDEYSDTVLSERIEKLPRQSNRVLQFDLSGDLVKKHRSISEAGKMIGVSQQAIYYCCVGKTNQTKGYVFLYEKDVTEDALKERLSRVQ